MSQNIADAQSSAERGLEGAPQSPKGLEVGGNRVLDKG